jgi:hypothetical protein
MIGTAAAPAADAADDVVFGHPHVGEALDAFTETKSVFIGLG